jgi:uncharacterized membrane protein (UPF0182 family)
MTDVNEFYNREDMWAWPEEIFGDTPQRIEPYYVLMQLPERDALVYVLILPFTPANRENMIAWMAAASDPENYGRILVYEFGKDSLFYGPKQVEARIDQNPAISAQLSLWNQQGSSVIRGNLLVIPVGGSLLYVEPLYLQAAAGRIPELARVVAATADEVVMAENLGLALVSLFGQEVLEDATLAGLASFGGEGIVDMPTGDEGTVLLASTDNAVRDLVTQANEQFAQAQAYLRAGDWAGYGRELAALEATLNQLAAQVAEDEMDEAAPVAPESTPAQPENAGP